MPFLRLIVSIGLIVPCIIIPISIRKSRSVLVGAATRNLLVLLFVAQPLQRLQAAALAFQQSTSLGLALFIGSLLAGSKSQLVPAKQYLLTELSLDRG